MTESHTARDAPTPSHQPETDIAYPPACLSVRNANTAKASPVITAVTKRALEHPSLTSRTPDCVALRGSQLFEELPNAAVPLGRREINILLLAACLGILDW